MGKLYFVDVGYMEQTVIYELKPVEVGRLKPGSSLAEIAYALHDMKANNVLVDRQRGQITT